jgi:multidrug efflux pump subunit AcrA (membrane-fusion protein)
MSPPEPAAVPVRTRTIALLGMGALGAFLILLAVGVVPRVLNRRQLAQAAQQARTTPARVYVIRPEPAAAAELSLAATTQAIQDAIIYARTSGYLRRRYVDIGDQVKAGQLLAEIASPEIDRQLRQGEADLRQARQNLDLQRVTLALARRTMDRYQAADGQGAVAKQAVDQNVSAHRTTLAAVAAAEANVQSFHANVQRLRALVSFEQVVAPFSGTVIQRNVDVGGLITAGSPVNNTAVAPSSVAGAANGLFEVGQLDALRVFVNLPQVYAAEVIVGLPVEVTVRGRLMQPVAAEVSRTAGALDPATRTLLTQVDIPNQTHRLMSGMFVYVTFNIGPSGTHWRLPASALIFDAQGTRVAIVGPGNKLHFQAVGLGRDLGTSIDVQSGIKGDETIVQQPTVALQEGQIVTPVEPKSSSGG